MKKKNVGSRSDESLLIQHVKNVKGTKRFPSWLQIKNFHHILSPKERSRFFAGKIISTLGILCILAGFVTQNITTIPKQGGTLTEGVLGSPRLINPLYSKASAVDKEIEALIFEGLLAYNPETGTYDNVLAESITVSEDEKTYTITLKTNRVWHDGEPFSKEDVLFTFDALKNPAYQSPLQGIYAGVTVSESEQENTVIFTLENPSATARDLLTIGILPKHLWEEVQPENALLAQLNLKPVGTGAYTMKKITKDNNGNVKNITLEKSETTSKNPYIKEISFKFFQNTQDLAQALQTKRIDATAALSLEEARTTKQDDETLTLSALPLTQYIGAFFNTQKAPFTDKNLRKALTSALDIQSIVAQASSNTLTPIGITLPGIEDTSFAQQDLEKAKSTLDELGWVQNEEGKRKKDETFLTISITTPNRTDFIGLAEGIAQTWNEIGIATTITTLDASTLTTTLSEKTYDVIIGGQAYSAIADPSPFWHSSERGVLNMSQFGNETLDAACVTLKTTQNQEKRTEALTTLKNILSEEQPYIPLTQNIVPYVHTVDILGITQQNLRTTTDRWMQQPLWYKKTGISWNF